MIRSPMSFRRGGIRIPVRRIPQPARVFRRIRSAVREAGRCRAADCCRRSCRGRLSFPRLRVDSFAVGDGGLEFVILLLRPAAAVFGEVVDHPFPAARKHLVGKEADDGRVHAGVGLVRHALENNGHFVRYVAYCHSLHALPPSPGCSLKSKSASIVSYCAVERNGQLKGLKRLLQAHCLFFRHFADFAEIDRSPSR